MGYIKDVPKCGSYPKKLCYSFGDKTSGWRLNSSDDGDTPDHHSNSVMQDGAQRDFPVNDSVRLNPNSYGNHVMQAGHPANHFNSGVPGNQNSYSNSVMQVGQPGAAHNFQFPPMRPKLSTAPQLQTFNTLSNDIVLNSNTSKCDINDIKTEDTQDLSDENKMVPKNNGQVSNSETADKKNSAMNESGITADDIKTEPGEGKEESVNKVEVLSCTVKKEENTEGDVKPVIIGHIEQLKSPDADPDSEHELVIDIKKEPE